MVVELDRVLAVYSAHIGEVLPSKVPAMTSVGMLLVVTSLMESGALGTSQTAQSSVKNGSCGACESTESGYSGNAILPFASMSDCGSNGTHSLQNTPKVKP